MSEHILKCGDLEFKDGKITAKVVLDRIRDVDPFNNGIYNRHDELSLGHMFSDVFRHVARYNTTAKEWFVFDGKVWKRDEGSMTVEQYAKMFQRALMVYSTEITNDRSLDEVSEYQKYIAKLGARGKRVTMLQDARDFNFVSNDAFDRDPFLLNCQNCVINLRTMERLEHDPNLMLSKISNVWFDPDAESGEFLKFLSEIMLGDKDKMSYLQRLFGYVMIGENTQEACYLCYGSTTRNGKSTLLEIIGYMLGDYAMNIQPETLAQKDKNSRNASGDIARLDGCRFLHCSEPPKKMRFDVALLKTLIGRDKITARHMYEREFEFVPVFKLVINTNHLPLVADDTLFSSERIKVITFDRHFEPEEQDRTLKRRLKSRDNISGIFNWCLEGLRLFEEAGEVLTEPESVKEATRDYRRASDKVQRYIDDCLNPAIGVNVSVKEAYIYYGMWCRDNGYGVENKGNFLEELKTKGLFAPSGTVDGRTVHNVITNHMFNPDILNTFNSVYE